MKYRHELLNFAFADDHPFQLKEWTLLSATERGASLFRLQTFLSAKLETKKLSLFFIDVFFIFLYLSRIAFPVLMWTVINEGPA